MPCPTLQELPQPPINPGLLPPKVHALEVTNLKAQRRLLDAEPLGGSREVSLLGDRNEVAQVSQIHACNTGNVLIPLYPYIGQLG